MLLLVEREREREKTQPCAVSSTTFKGEFGGVRGLGIADGLAWN